MGRTTGRKARHPHAVEGPMNDRKDAQREGDRLGMACSFILGLVIGAALFMFASGAFSGSGRP